MRADDLDRSIITVLTSRRIAAGMTQEDLAVAVNDLKIGLEWTRSHVAAIESGRRKSLRVTEVIALCIVHEVTMPEVLLQAGVEERYVAALVEATVGEVVLRDDLDALQRRVRIARAALDPDGPAPSSCP